MPRPRGSSESSTGRPSPRQRRLAPYTWSLASGTLPPGSPRSRDRRAQRAATGTGIFPFTLSVKDAGARRHDQRHDQRRPDARHRDRTPARRQGRKSLPRKARRAGRLVPRTWAVTRGALPRGVRLDRKTGVLSGTPRASGTFRFRITVSDPFPRRRRRPTCSRSAPSTPPCASSSSAREASGQRSPGSRARRSFFDACTLADYDLGTPGVARRRARRRPLPGSGASTRETRQACSS